MNNRQKKKRDKQQITVIVGCNMIAKAEDYEKMRKSIEYQLRAGSVVVLPAYLHVEAVIQPYGSRSIEIRRESEVKQNEVQTVEKEL